MDNYEPIKIVLHKADRYGEPKGHYAECPGMEATAVLNFIEKWGMVAAAPDGEDSAGRQKLRLATPEEMVARAMQTTEAAFRTLRAHGWIAPSVELAGAPAEVKAEAI